MPGHGTPGAPGEPGGGERFAGHLAESRAAVLELSHNAFLIPDDVEDRARRANRRRDRPSSSTGRRHPPRQRGVSSTTGMSRAVPAWYLS